VAEKKYAFRRERDGNIVWVDWAAMLESQNGYITLADGTEARRCAHLERRESRRGGPQVGGTPPPAVSDGVGFPEQCLEKYQADLDSSRLTGIEFKRDPACPEFYQVHGSSRAALDRYIRHRGLVNRTGSLGGGLKLSQEDMDRAAELVSR
jgi:hypothetical protein